MYARIENGNVTAWPVSEDHIKAKGDNIKNYTRVTPKNKPEYDPRYEYVIEGNPIFIDGVLCQYWQKRQQPIRMMRLSLKRHLKSIRQKKRNSGIFLDDGFFVETDVDGARLITDLYHGMVLSEGEIPIVSLKGEDGFRSFDQDGMKVVHSKVFAHVQACFSAEALVCQDIDALKTVDQLMEYDVDKSFIKYYKSGLSDT